MSRVRPNILRRRDPLRVGYLAVSDCAPLVYAFEGGLFDKYGLEVHLQRETSWANVRDKVIQGELDAAHAPATLPFLANLGIESDPCACVSGLVLSLQGNAITISRRLWDEGVRDAAGLRERIYRNWGKRTFTFGVVFSLSSQEILLRGWLKSAGIVPEADVRIVAVPPAQMFPTLKLGYIDGYCVGEPWTSVAIQAGAGMCVATSEELAPLHPERVLMVRQSFALGRAEEHERMIGALLESCAFCERPENRSLLGQILAHPQYLNAPVECVQAGLPQPFNSNDNSPARLCASSIFSRYNANEPSDDKAGWIIERLYELLQQDVFKPRNSGRAPVLKNIFRKDIFARARALVADGTQGRSPASTHEPILAPNG
ncbi:MAG TPA: CmpA/NrtA family ABC transporter substrate-binding protein [Verrucomicrobiae bacterium]|nr:CmpA/NrtA family ABC transporter substrate-binding protein [Verrucomicrobiae bacterium]